MSRLINRNVTATGGRTSMRLEPELWAALEEICHREDMTLAGLVKKVEAGRRDSSEEGRTSAVRIFAFNYFRAAVTEEGHAAAGHGEVNKVVDAGWRP